MWFKKKKKEVYIPQQSLFKIYSYYNSNVNKEVPGYQKAVFNKFGLSINHVFDDRYTEHGDFLNDICKRVTDTDYLIIFDIDCIPTSKEWLQLLLNDLLKPRTIVGAAQTANHLRDAKNLYISPFFFAISTAYLKELNYPDLKMTDDMDGGQNLTEVITKAGGNVKYWWPTHIEEEKWYLHHPEYNIFGLGTTYNNAIYHAFYSRDNLSERFIAKCKAILAAD